MKKNQRTTVKLNITLLALLMATVTGSVTAQSTGNSSAPQKKEHSNINTFANFENAYKTMKSSLYTV